MTHKILSKLPRDASYQGVNDKGEPMFFSKKTGRTYVSLHGYGTPLYGSPRAGGKFKVI